MREYYIVDRIEGNKVILESFYNNMITVDKKYIVDKIKDGDVLIKKENLFYYDNDATIKRKKVIGNITKDMWE